jgi:hypothetical protein
MARSQTKTGVPAIDNLDLREIVAAVRKHRRWSAKTAKDAETWYRFFLAMSQKKDGIAAFGIEERSDYVWHEHITNTKRYREDCERIFGKFLDHTPGRPKDWRARLSQSMKEYDTAFGHHPPDAGVCCF